MSIAVTGALCAAAVTTAAVAAKPTTRNRAEIPAEFRWDFSADLPELGGVGSGHEGDGRADGRVRRAEGNARAGPGAAAQGLPGVRRDRQAAVPRSTAIRSCSATSTRATRRSPAASSAWARCSPSSTPRSAWFTPELLTIPEATVQRLDRADAGARALPLPDPRQLPAARRTCSTTRASGCSRSPASSTTRRATIYQELTTSDIKFPTLTLADGKEVVAEPGQLRARCSRRTATRPSAAKAAAAHVGTYGATAQHLRRDLQRRAAARLVHRPGAQLPDHARRRARRQRDPARGRRDADRRDPRRLGAVPALRAAAQEAARPAETTTSTTASCRSTAATRPIPYEQARELALAVGRAARRRVRRPSTSASSPAAGSTSTRTKASAAAPTAPASTASARTC